MRKYLDDAGVPEGSRPEGYCSDDDPRMERFVRQRETYGFDERETWSLDSAFYLWLYERLMMYKELGGEIVDLTFNRFDYGGEAFSQAELIDMMIERLRVAIRGDYDEYDAERWNYVHEIEKIWAVVLPAMWW